MNGDSPTTLTKDTMDFSGYPSGLTVTSIMLLLHYFATPVDAEGALDRDHVNYKAIKHLEAAGLISLARSELGSWELTERGGCMARHIMNTPLPTAEWKIR